MTLSIIVPVYNVRPFLEKCVDSLLAQDLPPEEYEIILVDDGSTDGGGELCDRLMDQHPAIRVIHQVNQGLSAARNAGLSLAQGEYVQFVDSDDWIESHVLGELTSIMKARELDVLRFGYRRVREDGVPEDISQGKAPEGAGEVQTGKHFLIHHLGFSCYAWQFLLRRYFLEQENLYFKPGIIFEDTEWTPRVLQAAGRICGTDTLVYNYLERPGSIMRGKVHSRVKGQFLLIDQMQAQMRDADDKRWYQGMIAHIVVTIISTLATDLYEDRKPYLAELQGKKVLPLSSFMSGKKARRKINLINLSPALACSVIHILNR